jgi:dCTP deaminase
MEKSSNMKNPFPAGTLCDTQLRLLAKQRQLERFDLDHLQPSSWDLRIGDRITEISAVPNLDGKTHILDFIESHRLNEHVLGMGGSVTLNPGSLYICEIPGSLHLPPYLDGMVNPKSSLGRIFAGIQVVTENPTAINHIPKGYNGRLYMLIAPHIIRLTVRGGEPAAQLRIRSGKQRIYRGNALAQLVQEQGVIVAGGRAASIQEGGIQLHLDLSLEPCNYVGNPSGRTLDLQRKDTDPTDYFAPKALYNGKLYVNPGQCVLAASCEKLAIPRGVCGEMDAHNHRYGALLSHDAGFFDPHFGWTPKIEERGARAVFEIRNIGPNTLILRHGQAIGLLTLEAMSQEPEVPYGSTGTNNYQLQDGVRLAKFFADLLAA